MTSLLESVKKLIGNNKTLSKNLLYTVCLRTISLFVSFFATTAYMSYFKDDIALGVWFTILSILNWVLNFDLGIGNGLRNELSKYYQNDKKQAKKLITSAYVSLGFVCILLFFIFQLLSLFLNWNTILNVQSISATALNTAISISVLGICVQLWLKIIVSIFYSMQRVVYADLCALISNALVIVYLLTIDFSDAESKLIALSGWYSISLCLPLIVLTVVAFTRLIPDIRPGKKCYDSSIAKSITSLGGQFFIIQLSLLLMNSTNQWLISYLCAPEHVVEYQVYYKVFEIAITVFSLFTQPIWSAVSTAKNEGRFKWIKRAYIFMLGIAICGIICTCFVAVGLQYIFDFWLNKYSITANLGIAFLFVFLVAIQMLTYASTCIANGTNELKVQMIWTPICAVLKFPIAIILHRYFNEWFVIVLAFSVSQLPLLIIQIISLIGYFRRHPSDTHEIRVENVKDTD